MTSVDPRRPPLDPVRLAELAPAWTTVEVLDEAPSTNALVAARARAGDGHGLVVVADHQTAGRGRLDRRWVTPPRAALTFSVLLRPEAPDERWPWLPLLAGVAVVEGIAQCGGPGCALKWPNDVTYGGRKLAGLLVERIETASGAAAVVGVGLNVSTVAEELPVPGAASLATVGWSGMDRVRLLVEVLEVLGVRLNRWSRDSGEELFEDYVTLCETVGQEVRVDLPARTQLAGTAVGVDPHGGLRVRTGAEVVTVSAGDVVHVRPA